MPTNFQDAASPCRHVDLPQTLLEPILVRHALAKDWSVRFETTFIDFQRDSPIGPITSTLKDNLTGQNYTVQSKYLISCDGARSQIMKQLDLPLLKKPGQGLAINVLAEVDLSKHMLSRKGNLHYIVQPDIEHPGWGWACVLRMVKPCKPAQRWETQTRVEAFIWNSNILKLKLTLCFSCSGHEFMFIILPEPGFEDFRVRPSNEEYMKRLREFVGDDSIPINIKVGDNFLSLRRGRP